MANKSDKYEPASARIEEAGKGELDDEMLPNKGKPVAQPKSGDDRYDTAGQHGEMDVSGAKAIEKKAEESERS